MSNKLCISSGDRYGQLTIMMEVPSTPSVGRLIQCLCDCGNTTTVRLSFLRNRHTASCGCLQRERSREASILSNTVHGHSAGAKWSGEYTTWTQMKQRCLNPRHFSYHDYGGRGISICAEWRLSFAAFLRDVGPRPSGGYSIDRIDYDGNYEPGNVRWATATQQNRNRRSVKMLTISGITKPLIEWAEISGRNIHTIRGRLHYGWTPEEAVFRPLRSYTGASGGKLAGPGPSESSSDSSDNPGSESLTLR